MQNAHSLSHSNDQCCLLYIPTHVKSSAWSYRFDKMPGMDRMKSGVGRRVTWSGICREVTNHGTQRGPV